MYIVVGMMSFPPDSLDFADLGSGNKIVYEIADLVAWTSVRTENECDAEQFAGVVQLQLDCHHGGSQDQEEADDSCPCRVAGD